MVNKGLTLVEMLISVGFVILIATGLFVYFGTEVGTHGVLTDERRNYVGYSEEECSRIQVMCVDGFQYFKDDSGCGCQEIAENER